MKVNLARFYRYSVIGLVIQFCFQLVAAEPQKAPPSPWSLRPIQAPTLPEVKTHDWARNPVDLFILHRLESEGINPSPEADRRTLIRRLTFDLHGLPPTPEEIEAFESDESSRAYERLVDRLLASPRYGERWARHWLDVARYTESQGFEYDHLRDNAWHYRDYVINAFNSDKPYNRFIKEQIAGDMLQPVTTEGIVATSFLVCGPWDQAGSSQANATQRAITREEELEDLVSVVSQGFLGITVHCARCHSHKFDPVPQLDYYRIKSVFEGIRHGESVIAPPDVVAESEKVRAPIKERIRDLEGKIGELDKTAKDRALSEEEKNQRQTLIGQLETARKELNQLPILPVSYVGLRQVPAPTRLLKRGEVTSPQEEVTPGALSAISEPSPDFNLAANSPEGERRLKFAEWVSDSRNPLSPRVMVNRIWYYHFGRGLVATPSDFGNSGAKPTHPELLDWLAASFLENGWSIKHVHRLIVLSATYRQLSNFREEPANKDPDNSLYWRFSPKRLEAEAIRDSMLAISGEMDWRQGGPSFRPFEILKFGSSTYIPIQEMRPEFNRRTIYRANVNSGKDPLLDTLDCPDPSVKTPVRGITITPLQALGLMNNPFVEHQARALAQRALASSNGDVADAITRAYQDVLGRVPSPREHSRALGAANDRGLWHVCWALLNSTEFIYVP